MNTTSKIIGAVIIVALLVGVGVYFVKRQPQSANQNQNKNGQNAQNQEVITQEPGQHKDTATAGKLIKGFPPELILENNATITESFKEDYNATTFQYTAKYSSSKTPKDLHKLYADYFTKNSYTISNDLNTDTIAALYAVKGNTVVNFNASKIDPKGPTQVVITYLVSTDKK